MYKKRCDYNVVIFNNIKNNQEDIKLLQKTFENFDCRIKLYEFLKLNEYDKAIEEMCTANFAVYEYIVVIVLDNTNLYNHILIKNDEEELRINNDLFTKILQNPTLLDKKKLYIIQTNQIYSDEPIEPSSYRVYYDKEGEIMKVYAGPSIHLYATGPETQLEDYWPTPNSPPSPFINSFCMNFNKYGEYKSIQYIYQKICQDLKDENFIPVVDFNPEVIFGKALTAREIEDFFPDYDSSNEDSSDY